MADCHCCCASQECACKLWMADCCVRPTRQSNESNRITSIALISCIKRAGFDFVALPLIIRTTVMSRITRARIPATIPMRIAPAAQSLPVSCNTISRRATSTILPISIQMGIGLDNVLYPGCSKLGEGVFDGFAKCIPHLPQYVALSGLEDPHWLQIMIRLEL